MGRKLTSDDVFDLNQLLKVNKSNLQYFKTTSENGTNTYELRTVDPFIDSTTSQIVNLNENEFNKFINNFKTNRDIVDTGYSNTYKMLITRKDITKL